MKGFAGTYPRSAIWLAAALGIVDAWHSPGVAAEEEPPRSMSLVCLDAEEPDTTGIEASGKLFLRELLRQAVLMAARDEVGQGTRDRVLREDFPDGAQAFAVKTSHNKSRHWQLKILAPGNGDEVLFERRLEILANEPGTIDYLAHVALAEELIRTDLKKFWQQRFADGKANGTDSTKSVPPETARDVEQMNCVSQISALRDLHELHRTQGESPATMAALIRAYAHLGQLTMLHWNASHCVYQTRSLLYAQRWCAREPRSALAMWHRAYALALAGFHQQALLDSKTAEELAKNAGDPKQSSRPGWVPLIEGLCRYDIDNLYEETKKTGPYTQLAWLCTYLAVEPGADAENERLTIGFEALKGAPECLRISASMACTEGYDAKHRATKHGVKTVTSAWRTRLLGMNGLPGAVRQTADKITPAPEDYIFGRGTDVPGLFADVRPVVEACVAAGDADRGEPSMAALGRLLEDMTFVEVANRQDFYAVAWGYGQLPDQHIQAALDLFPHHPYRVFFTVAAMHPQPDKENYWKPLADLDIVDADTSHHLLIDRTRGTPFAERIQGRRALNLALAHADDAAYALSFYLQYALDQGQQVQRAETLTKVSPYCPLGMATLIRLDWDKYAQGKEAELEKEYADRPLVLAALARQYLNRNRPDDAQRALEAYLRLSSGWWAYEALANIYLSRGDEEQWLSTMLASLNHEDFFGMHEAVQEKLTRYYIAKKEWEKALPYAEAGIQLGAEWALDCAIICHTELEHWEEAEQYARFHPGRIEPTGPRWYVWCRMTGHGNLKEAHAAAIESYKQLEERATWQNWIPIGFFKYGEKDNEGALKAYRNAMDQTKSPLAALLSALIMDQEHRDAERDELLAGIAKLTPPEESRKVMVRLAAIVQSSLAKGPEHKLDIEAIENLANVSEEDSRDEICLVAGQYLENRGERKKAIEYYRRAAAITGWNFPKLGAAMRMWELEQQEGR